MEIAGSLFMYPKKRYGQHFLVDKNILRKIISAADIGKGEDVLEIGPGLGHLTQALLERGANVKAIEVDPSLAKELRRRFCGTKNLELIEADALRVSFFDAAKRGRAKAHSPARHERLRNPLRFYKGIRRGKTRI